MTSRTSATSAGTGRYHWAPPMLAGCIGDQGFVELEGVAGLCLKTTKTSRVHSGPHPWIVVSARRQDSASSPRPLWRQGDLTGGRRSVQQPGAVQHWCRPLQFELGVSLAYGPLYSAAGFSCRQGHLRPLQLRSAVKA